MHSNAFGSIWLQGDWAARGEMICAAAEAVDFGLSILNHTTNPRYQLGNQFQFDWTYFFCHVLDSSVLHHRIPSLHFSQGRADHNSQFANNHPLYKQGIHVRNTSQNPGQQYFHLLILLIASSIQVIQHDPTRISATCAQVAHIYFRFETFWCQAKHQRVMCVLTNRLHSLQADSTCGDSLCRVCSFLLPFSRLVILQGCLKSIFHQSWHKYITFKTPAMLFSVIQ